MKRNVAVTVMATLVLAGTLAGAAGGVVGASAGAQSSIHTETEAQAQSECGFPVEVQDATGETVTIEEEPQRVVTTNPSAAQTMKEIGAWDKVVGVTQYAAYLEGADEKANVSGPSGASVEKVVAQEPDLVLVPNATFGSSDLVGQLRDAGLTVYHFDESESIEDVRQKTLLTGELVGECDGAEETVAWMDEQLAPVEETVQSEEPVRALYVFFGYTVGDDTFIGSMIEAAGGTNVAGEQGISGYREISDETVAAADPEWLVLNDNNPSVPESEAYQGTTAVQEGNVVVVQENHISQPAPRVVYAVQKMAQAFHPEAFAEANATATPSPTDDHTATATPGTTDEVTPSPTPTQSPGFGLLAALVALVGALALTRGR